MLLHGRGSAYDLITTDTRAQGTDPVTSVEGPPRHQRGGGGYSGRVLDRKEDVSSSVSQL